MTRYSRLAASLLVTLALVSPCLAQGTLQGLGSVVAGQIPMYVGHNQVIGTGGAPGVGQAPLNQSNPGTLPSGLAMVNSGQGLALYSGYANAAYSSLKAGFDGNGNVLFTIERSAGGNPPTCSFDIGGTLYACGSSGGGIVGPNPTTVGHLVLWNNGLGTAARDAGTMLVSILAYGAVSGTDSATAIQAAITAGCAGGFGVYVPDGDWQTTAMLTIPCSKFKLQGQSLGAKIRYTGGGSVAAAIQVTGANLWNVSVADLTIQGNGQSVAALDTWKVLHSHFTDLKLRDAGTTCLAGSFGVLNSYKNISCSHNEEAFGTIPVKCIKFYDRDTNGGIYASHIDNFICEGVSGDGIDLATSNDNIFTGGSSEGNGARGVILASDTNRNTFNNMDMEANFTEDAKDSGQFNAWNNVVSCCVGRFRITAAANGTMIEGGTFDNLTVEANSGTTYPLIVHPGYISNSYAFGSGTAVWDFNGPWSLSVFTPACNTGTLTAATGLGRWRVQGKTVNFVGRVNITTNGTCSDTLRMVLPFTPVSTGPINHVCVGRDEGIGGKLLSGQMDGTAILYVRNYDNTYPGANGSAIDISCTYERL